MTLYVRFLNAADAAHDEAWDVGRLRTSVQTLEQGQKNYRDWRDRVSAVEQLVTELSLLAPQAVVEPSQEVAVRVTAFGNDALLAGTEAGMAMLPRVHDEAFVASRKRLLDAMRPDLAPSKAPATTRASKRHQKVRSGS